MVWFLFEVVEYNLVTLLCHILIALMLILFVWHNAAGLITWRLPNIYDLEIPDYTVRFLHNKFNFFLRKFYDIATGKDLRFFFVRYEHEVDYLASKGNQDVKRLFNKLDSTVLNRIPRGPVKEKKLR
ncbi:reticulon-like protein B2 [Trifolium pratense]|uniref:Reticulon-like protein B2 n=1 Tax=Trifolium pratense TaxID=57577 RepID=A0A2K3LEU9_TRIPR|nr:reticulon-like protein B2 [Trifolium pratense]